MRLRYSSAENVRFLCVYLREAHASDVWPINGPEVSEPRSTEERISVAGRFQLACQLNWPMAVDGVEDPFLKAYSPWPFRMYVLHDNILAHKTQPSRGTHHTDRVEELLRQFVR